jgi:hypothetical protein
LKVENYIGELLQMHDCVIVPSFGGFIANYAPARITERNTFSPPSKNIAFNINLKNNDGLLVNHIAVAENIPFNDALNIINNQVIDWNDALNNGKTISIKNVGKIYFDKDLNLQFQSVKSDYFLLESFGLVEFNSPVIKRDSSYKKIEKQFKDRPAIKQTTTGFKWKKTIITLFSIPLLAAMAILPHQNELFYKLSLEYSTLNPFNQLELPKYQPRVNIESEVEVENISESFIDAPETSVTIIETQAPNYSSIDYPFEAVPKFDLELKEDVIINEAKSTVKSSAESAQQFFIIGGCFSKEENAAKFALELQSAGHSASIADQHKGLYRVAFGNYSSMSEAAAALSNLQSEHKGAWILKL